MSKKAFRAHAEKQVQNVKNSVKVSGGAGLEQTLLRNPLGLISVLGFTNSVEEEDLFMFMAAATLNYENQFGKFENICSDRYMAVIHFLHLSFDEMKNDLNAAMLIRNDCYEWLHDTDAPIHPELKSKFEKTVQELDVVREQDALAKNTPMGASALANSPTFKI